MSDEAELLSLNAEALAEWRGIVERLTIKGMDKGQPTDGAVRDAVKAADYLMGEAIKRYGSRK